MPNPIKMYTLDSESDNQKDNSIIVKDKFVM